MTNANILFSDQGIDENLSALKGKNYRVFFSSLLTSARWDNRLAKGIAKFKRQFGITHAAIFAPDLDVIPREIINQRLVQVKAYLKERDADVKFHVFIITIKDYTELRRMFKDGVFNKQP